MKTFNKIILSMSAALAFVSCVEDTGLDVYQNQLYLTTSEKTKLLYVSTENSYTDVLVAALAKPHTETVEMKYSVDESLVEVYNEIYDDTAVMLPAENYLLSSETDQINAGDVRSSSITVDFINVLDLDKEVRYVLPVRIKEANIKILETRCTKYYVFEGANLVNIVADMHDNFCTVDWQNPSVVTGMQEVTFEALVNASWGGCPEHMCTIMGIESYFLLRVGDVGIPNNRTQFCAYEASGPTGPDLEYDKWIHLVMTFSIADGRVRFYVNGQEKSSSGVNTSAYRRTGGVNLDNDLVNDPVFHIGTAYNLTRNLCGFLSECRIWNRVLTPDEIAEQTVRPYYVDPKSDGLVAYWKFNEGSGSTVIDRTGNGNDAIANNPIKWTKITLPAE